MQVESPTLLLVITSPQQETQTSLQFEALRPPIHLLSTHTHAHTHTK